MFPHFGRAETGFKKQPHRWERVKFMGLAHDYETTGPANSQKVFVNLPILFRLKMGLKTPKGGTP